MRTEAAPGTRQARRGERVIDVSGDGPNNRGILVNLARDRAAVAADKPVTLAAGERALIPSGFSIAVPDGFELQVRPRSGLAMRHGVTVLNAPGTVDSDYRGEVMVLLVNLGGEPFRIERGERIFMPGEFVQGTIGEYDIRLDAPVLGALLAPLAQGFIALLCRLVPAVVVGASRPLWRIVAQPVGDDGEQLFARLGRQAARDALDL